MLTAFFDDARAWASGKTWQPRAALLVLCTWIFLRHLKDPLYGGIVKGLNLAIHEIGHVLFGFLGDLIGMGVYAADARAGDLPLVGIGTADPEHDWFIMLAETDLLNHDKIIGGFFRLMGALSFAAGLSFGAWVVMQTRKLENLTT